MPTQYRSFRKDPVGLMHALMTQGNRGGVHFKYRKADGSIRFAIGRIPKRFVDDMGIDGRYFRYWDIQRKDWRSFLLSNLL